MAKHYRDLTATDSVTIPHDTISDMAASVYHTKTETELRSQPECWQRSRQLLPDIASSLPRTGEKVLVVGCGTSWFVADAYAKLREGTVGSPTDAYTATEAPLGRDYDRILALSRSGTTTEIIDILRATSIPSTLVTAVANGPAAEHADTEIVLDFADEESVVQTRFATTTVALLRASLGEDISAAIGDAEAVLADEPTDELIDAEQIAFIGTNWTKGLADEAALKLRESCQSWTESYYAMEYRHGPISIAEPGRVTYCFGAPPAGLADQVAATGATFVASGRDPLADLVAVHLLAVRRAAKKGLDPDRPRHLTRAVHLDS